MPVTITKSMGSQGGGWGGPGEAITPSPAHDPLHCCRSTLSQPSKGSAGESAQPRNTYHVLTITNGEPELTARPFLEVSMGHPGLCVVV